MGAPADPTTDDIRPTGDEGVLVGSEGEVGESLRVSSETHLDGCPGRFNVGWTADLFELEKHLLHGLPADPHPVHRVVHDKVIGAERVDDIGVSLAPELGKVLGDDGEVLRFLLRRHVDEVGDVFSEIDDELMIRVSCARQVDADGVFIQTNPTL